jgi:cob(I)alamin adenosyltransferase
MKGYVQVYTGDGKGKTTAALGLAIRAVGAGYKVFIGQFIKMGEYSEIKALKERVSDMVTIEQFGSGRFVKGTPTPEQIELARKGIERIQSVMVSGEFQVIILEEANIAVSLGLLSSEQLLALIDTKPKNVELVFTGRNAPDFLMNKADLVTEMKEIKHYFKKGVRARTGIEK